MEIALSFSGNGLVFSSQRKLESGEIDCIYFVTKGKNITTQAKMRILDAFIKHKNIDTTTANFNEMYNRTIETMHVEYGDYGVDEYGNGNGLTRGSSGCIIDIDTWKVTEFKFDRNKFGAQLCECKLRQENDDINISVSSSSSGWNFITRKPEYIEMPEIHRLIKQLKTIAKRTGTKLYGINESIKSLNDRVWDEYYERYEILLARHSVERVFIQNNVIPHVDNMTLDKVKSLQKTYEELHGVKEHYWNADEPYRTVVRFRDELKENIALLEGLTKNQSVKMLRMEVA